MAKKLTALMETETPEKRAEIIAEEIKHEKGIDALRAEIKRLENVIRDKNTIISNLQAANEQISDELSKARNK